MATALAHPDTLTKIFQKLDESEQRAQLQYQLECADPAAIVATRAALRERRRTSISISRFGQPQDDDMHVHTSSFTVPATPTTLAVATLYRQQECPQSTDSLESNLSDEDAFDRHRESNHVTQVQRIAARQSIRQSVGGMLQRTLSRSRSKQQLSQLSDMDVVIDVVVEKAKTVEHETIYAGVRSESRAMAYADFPARPLRSQSSRFTLASTTAEKRGFATRARELGRRLRNRSQSVLISPAPSPRS